MNGGTVMRNKLWQIGKVYRRDQPVMSEGRMREFMQAVSSPSLGCYCKLMNGIVFLRL
ncbi:hypothetical protein BDZ97DRAFT_1837983 [Flammula alnicola]|nr:hypothetical protein BDZ97DRAFT_1837983 [Flammula alnicola]